MKQFFKTIKNRIDAEGDFWAMAIVLFIIDWLYEPTINHLAFVADQFYCAYGYYLAISQNASWKQLLFLVADLGIGLRYYLVGLDW